MRGRFGTVEEDQHPGDKAMDYRAFLFNLVFFHVIVEEIFMEVFRR